MAGQQQEEPARGGVMLDANICRQQVGRAATECACCGGFNSNEKSDGVAKQHKLFGVTASMS